MKQNDAPPSAIFGGRPAKSRSAENKKAPPKPNKGEEAKRNIGALTTKTHGKIHKVLVASGKNLKKREIARKNLAYAGEIKGWTTR